MQEEDLAPTVEMLTSDDEQHSNTDDDMREYADDYEPYDDDDQQSSSDDSFETPELAALYIMQKYEDKEHVEEEELRLAQYVLQQIKNKLQ